MKALGVRSGRLIPVQPRPSRASPSVHRLHRQARAVASADTLAPNAVQVSFYVPFSTKFGESLRIVGADECVGSWNVDNAPLLQWSEGDIWTATISITPGATLEYKLVWQSLNGVQWEAIPNRTVSVDAGTRHSQLLCGRISSVQELVRCGWIACGTRRMRWSPRWRSMSMRRMRRRWQPCRLPRSWMACLQRPWSQVRTQRF